MELFVIICLAVTVYIIINSVKKAKRIDEHKKGGFPKKKALAITIHLFKDGYGEKNFQLNKGHVFYINEDGEKEISGDWDYDFWQITSNKSNHAFEWIRDNQNNKNTSTLNFWKGGELSDVRKNISEDSAIDIVMDSNWIPGLDKLLLRNKKPLEGLFNTEDPNNLEPAYTNFLESPLAEIAYIFHSFAFLGDGEVTEEENRENMKNSLEIAFGWGYTKEDALEAWKQALRTHDECISLEVELAIFTDVLNKLGSRKMFGIEQKKDLVSRLERIMNVDHAQHEQELVLINKIKEKWNFGSPNIFGTGKEAGTGKFQELDSEGKVKFHDKYLDNTRMKMESVKKGAKNKETDNPKFGDILESNGFSLTSFPTDKFPVIPMDETMRLVGWGEDGLEFAELIDAADIPIESRPDNGLIYYSDRMSINQKFDTPLLVTTHGIVTLDPNEPAEDGVYMFLPFSSFKDIGIYTIQDSGSYGGELVIRLLGGPQVIGISSSILFDKPIVPKEEILCLYNSLNTFFKTAYKDDGDKVEIDLKNCIFLNSDKKEKKQEMIKKLVDLEIKSQKKNRDSRSKGIGDY